MRRQLPTAAKKQETKKQEPVVDQKSPEGFITVSRARYSMGEMYSEETTNDTVRVPLFPTSPAYVKVSGSVTRNTGNYNSVRVQVDISLPCLPEGSEIERVYNICSEFVNSKVQDELEFAYGRDQAVTEGQ